MNGKVKGFFRKWIGLVVFVLLLTITGVFYYAQADGIEAKVPEQITLELYRSVDNWNTEELVKVDGKNTFTISKDDNWEIILESLDRVNSAGKLYKYKVKEVDGNAGWEAYYDEATNTLYNVREDMKYETIDISGEKTWDDNGIENPKYPESIMVELWRDGIRIPEEDLTVTAADNWKYSFEGLDKYRKVSDTEYVEYKYEIKEAAVEGWEASYDGYNIINKATHYDIEGEKVWVENGVQDPKYPESITVELYQNGIKLDGREQVVTAENGWKYSFTNIPKWNTEGEAYTYTVKEASVPSGWTSSLSEGNYNIVNTAYETVDIKGEKKWEYDGRDIEKIQLPDSIAIKLYKQTEEGKELVDTKEIRESDDWKYSFEDLPKHDEQGSEILYSVGEEEAKGWITEVDGYNIINKVNQTSVTIEKKWESGGRTFTTAEKKKFTSTFELYQNGVYLRDIILDYSENGASETINFLPEKYIEDGEEKYYEYAIVEKVIPSGWKLSGSSVDNTDAYNKIFKFTNAINMVDVTIEKMWDSGGRDFTGEEDNHRATFQLIQNGNSIQTHTLSYSETNTTYTFKNLPASYIEDGQEKTYVYSVKEMDIPEGWISTGPEIDNSDERNTIYKFKNEADMIDITIDKIWKDDGKDVSERYKEDVSWIQVILFRDGVEYKTYTLVETELGNWRAVIKNLSKTNPETGEPYVYSLEETEITGWDLQGISETVDSAGNVSFVITNIPYPVVDVEVEKTWENQGYFDIADYNLQVEVELWRKKEDGSDEKKLDSKKLNGKIDDWTYTWKNLRKYYDGGTYTYEVREAGVTGDILNWNTETDDASGFNPLDNIWNYKIINTFINETTMTVKKIWDGPEWAVNNYWVIGIDIFKYYQNEHYETVYVQSDEWLQRINVPIFDGNGMIQYYAIENFYEDEWTSTVTEEQLADLSWEIVVENKYEVEDYVTFTIEKEWDDNSNEKGERPDVVYFDVYRFDPVMAEHYGYTDPYSMLGEDNIDEFVAAMKVICKKYDTIEVWNDGTDYWIEEFEWVVREYDPINQEGKEYAYYVEEVGEGVGPYKLAEQSGVIDQDKIVLYFRNELSQGTIFDEFTIRKKWEGDNDNIYNLRPDSIDVQVYATTTEGDEFFVETVSIPKADSNEWVYDQFISYQYYNGMEITDYYVIEIEPEHYNSYIDSVNVFDDKYECIIRNEFSMPKKNYYYFRKQWDDNANADGTRPDKLTIKLYGDHQDEPLQVREWEVNQTSTGVLSLYFYNLPMYDSHTGNLITYRVEEEVPEGYLAVSGTSSSLYNTMTNHLAKTDLTIKKQWVGADVGFRVIKTDDNDVGEDKIRLSGAEFTLYDQDKQNIIKVITTDENGVADFEGLEPGTYWLLETRPPAGYEGSAQDRWIEVELIYGDYPENKQIEVENTKLPTGDLEIIKVDRDDNNIVLEGVDFILYFKSGGTNFYYQVEEDIVSWTTDKEQASTLTTDKGGKISLESIPIGTYYLEEIETLDEYYLLGDVIEVEVKEEPTENKLIVIENAIIPDPDETGTLEVVKVDREDKATLSNVEFLLWYVEEDGEIFYYVRGEDGESHWTTDRESATVLRTKADGGFKVEDLLYRTYHLTEISVPEDYELLNDSVEVVIDRKVVKLTIENARIPFFVPDPWINILISKTEEGTEKGLFGAQFILYYEDNGANRYFTGNNNDTGEAIWSEDENEAKIVTTDSDGFAVFSGLSEEITYFLKEVKAPDGYLLPENNITQASQDAEDGWIKVGVKNKKDPTEPYPIEDLGVTKTDSTDEEIVLKGARFRLYYIGENPTVKYFYKNINEKIVTWTTDEDAAKIFVTDEHGKLKIEGLPPRTYYLEELEAPEGYTIIQSITEVVAAAGGENEYTIKNEPIPKEPDGEIEITKIDGITEKALEGVGFYLYFIQDNGGGGQSYFYSDDNGEITWTAEAEQATILYTDKDGKIKVTDLPYNTYYLREVQAPEGYKPLESDVELVLSEDNKKQTRTVENYSEDDNTPKGPRLEFEKMSDPETGKSVKAGDQISYTIRVKNTGDETAKDVIITDKIPEGTTYKEGTAWCSIEGVRVVYDAESNTVTWTIDELKPEDGEVIVGFTVTVNPLKEDEKEKGRMIKNQAFVQHDDEEPEGTNETKHPQEPEEPDPTGQGPKIEAGKTSQPPNGTKVSEGNKITYTIRVENAGDETAENVIITDKIPEGTKYVEGSVTSVPPVMELEGKGGVLILVWAVGDMEPGDKVEVCFTVEVEPLEDAQTGRIIENQAIIWQKDEPPQETNKTEHPQEPDDSNCAKEGPEIKSNKYSSPESGIKVKAGDSIKYFIEIKNTGDEAAHDMIITDKIPEGTTYKEGTAWCSIEGVRVVYDAESNTVTWTIDELKPEDGEVIVGFTVTVNPLKEDEKEKGRMIKNQAFVQHDDEEPEGTNETKHPQEPEEPDPTGQGPKIEAGKTSQPPNGTKVSEGNKITYTIRVENAGDETAENVIITDKIPEGTKYVEGSATSVPPVMELEGKGGVLILVWAVGDMEPGDKVEVCFTVEVEPLEDAQTGRIIENQAIIWQKDEPPQETNKTEHPQEPEVPDNPNPAVEEPNIEAEKYSDPETGTKVKTGDKITYFIKVKNSGAGTSHDMIITDDIPEGTTYVEGSASSKPEGIEPQLKGHTFTWHVGDLKAGEEAEVSFAVKVDAYEGDEIRHINNKAYVWHDDKENPDETGETKHPQDPDEPDTVVPPEEPVPEKTYADNSEAGKNGKAVKAGDKITYRISYYNVQDSDATVMITDRLDEGFVYLSADQNGTYYEESHSVLWIIKDVKPGDSGYVTLTVAVDDNVSGNVNNEAHVQIGDHAPVTTNKLTNKVTGSGGGGGNGNVTDNNTRKNKGGNGSPKTGDILSLLAVILFALSGCILVVIRINKKKYE